MLTHPEPHACRPTRRSSRSTPPTAASGSRRSSATSTSAWPARAGPRGKDFNMRWIASHGGRGAPHPDARRRLHVPARHQGRRQARAPAPAVRGQPDRASSSSRPAAAPAPGASRCSASSRRRCTSASAWCSARKHEVERIERYHHEPATRDAGNPLFAERGLFRDLKETHHVRTPSHHRHHRLVGRRHHLGDAHLREHLPPREESRPRSSRATASTATTAPR